MLNWLNRVKVEGVDLPSRATFKEIILVMTNIRGGVGQRKANKYLRENCFHHIKYSIANSLAALMWRLYLNSDVQPYSYP